MKKALYIMGLCILAMIGYSSEINSACVSGFVVDASGNPINNVDLDLFNAATGEKLVFPPGYNDNTNPLGDYRICVLPGFYHISFDPTDSTHFLGTKIFNVDIRTDIVLPDIVLGTGIVISGTITDSSSAPVVGADIDVDSLGGGRVYTPNDKSKILTGAYWIVVPPGQFRIRYDPPASGGRLRGFQIDSASIVRDSVINVSLMNGMLFSGFVTNSVGAGIYDVDIDLRDDSSGQKVFVSNNSTDSTGFYNVAVPTGTFEIRYTPPLGTRYVAELVDSFVISNDASWNLPLGEGVICSVYVHDSLGDPIPDIDLDLKYAGTATKLFTPDDKSNIDGYVVTAIFPGLYEVQLQPPAGAFFDQLILDSVPILTDTLLSLSLPEVQRINWSGQVVNSVGAGLAGVDIDLQSRISGKKAFIANNVSDSLGNFALAVPIGTFDALISAPVRSRYVSLNVENSIFNVDTTWQPIVLSSGVVFTASVFDDTGRPLSGADLDFDSETSSKQIYTPYDNTDALGFAVVAVPPDFYTINVDPPVNSTLLSTTLNGVLVANDTSLTFVLSGSALPSDVNFILQPNYPNPFNAETKIEYLLLSNDFVSLNIYNILGQHVKSLENKNLQVGRYIVPWDGTDEYGRQTASGVYFYRFQTNRGHETRRMILLK